MTCDSCQDEAIALDHHGHAVCWLHAFLPEQDGSNDLPAHVVTTLPTR
jgi:hypothetical protein